MKNLLKNAIVFKAHLPSIEEMTECIEEVYFKPVVSHAKSSMGFVSNGITGEMVTPISGGYAIQLRVDEKLIPRDVIKSKVDEKVKLIEQGEFRPLSRKEKSEITDEVLFDILPTALVRTKLIDAVYVADENILVVDTLRQVYASAIVGLLVKCCGSVKTETIHISNIKHGLTAKVKQHLADGESFGVFGVGSFCKLESSISSEKKTYEGAEFYSDESKLIDDIDSGFEVSDCELVLADTPFKLTSKFQIKGIQFEKQDSDDDKAYAWRCEAAMRSLFITKVVAGLIDLIEEK